MKPLNERFEHFLKSFWSVESCPRYIIADLFFVLPSTVESWTKKVPNRHIDAITRLCEFGENVLNQLPENIAPFLVMQKEVVQKHLATMITPEADVEKCLEAICEYLHIHSQFIKLELSHIPSWEDTYFDPLFGKKDILVQNHGILNPRIDKEYAAERLIATLVSLRFNPALEIIVSFNNYESDVTKEIRSPKSEDPEIFRKNLESLMTKNGFYRERASAILGTEERMFSRSSINIGVQKMEEKKLTHKSLNIGPHSEPALIIEKIISDNFRVTYAIYIPRKDKSTLSNLYEELNNNVSVDETLALVGRDAIVSAQQMVEKSLASDFMEIRFFINENPMSTCTLSDSDLVDYHLEVFCQYCSRLSWSAGQNLIQKMEKSIDNLQKVIKP